MRTTEEKITCALRDARDLDGSCWAEAMNYDAINRIPSSSFNSQTPYQAYYKMKPDLTAMRTFEAIAYALDLQKNK